MLEWFDKFFGPMFAKEMVEMSRRPRYFLVRVLLISILLVVFFMIWQETQHSWAYRNMSVAKRTTQFASNLFSSILWTEFISVLLLTPLFLFSVIAEERERNTLDLVFTTDLQDREIILGKYASRAVVLGFVVIGGMPVLAISGLFGGIDPNALLFASLTTLTAVMLSGSLTVYYSTVSKSPLGAMIRSFTTLACILVLLPLATALFLRGGGFGMTGSLSAIFWYQVFINPIYPFVASMVPVNDNMLRAQVGHHYFAFSLMVPIAVACLLTFLAIRRLKPIEAKKARNSKALADAPNKDHEEALSNRTRIRRGLPKRAESFFGVDVENPIWLRHRLALPYDRDGYIYKVQALAIVLWIGFLGLILLQAKHERVELSFVFLGIGWVFALLILVVVAGLSLNSDRRRGTLDMILQTTLTPQEVLNGTLLGILQYGMISVILCLLYLLILLMFGAIYPISFLFMLLIVIPFFALCILAAAGSSLSATSPLSAMIGAAFLPVIAIFGLPMTTSYLQESHRPLFLIGFPILALLSWKRYRKHLSGWLFGAYVTFLHLSVMVWMHFWNVTGPSVRYNSDMFPMELYHCGYMAFCHLAKSQWDLESHYSSMGTTYLGTRPLITGVPDWYHGVGPWWLPHLMYCAGSIAVFVIARKTLLNQFNRICDRPG